MKLIQRVAPGRRMLRQGADAASGAAGSGAGADGDKTFGGGGVGCLDRARCTTFMPPCAFKSCPEGTYCLEDPCRRPCAATCVPNGEGPMLRLGPGR
jgi:hypothetical protein